MPLLAFFKQIKLFGAFCTIFNKLGMEKKYKPSRHFI